MFDFLLTTFEIGETLTMGYFLKIVGLSLVLGLFISFGYMLTYRKKGWQQSFLITLIMLPAIIAIIILLIGNNAARALSLAGAFSIIRFRSAPGDPKDIAYVFFTLAAGLSCGMGYIVFAVVFVVIMTLVMFILEMLNFAAPGRCDMSLRITIPENLNFQGLFDDILNEYTVKWLMKRVKTTDFGSLFELQYDISVKKGIDQKTFIDLLRQRNSNLPIQLTLKEYEEQIAM